mmetsp:Transcript_26774/g.46436  ORF Transcript_26774/g.46436 Transcript_26774/m.46436 type:complete len:111 (-) Transcript_26774:58-390(-)
MKSPSDGNDRQASKPIRRLSFADQTDQVAETQARGSLSKSGSKILDFRSTGSKADHDRIVNTLQQGLGNVESVCLYDAEQWQDHHEEGLNDGAGIWRKIAKFVSKCCACH